MEVVRSLPTNARPRIVALLKELLEQAEKGNITGILVYTDMADGSFESARDGMSDRDLMFAMGLLHKRILGKYE